MMRSTKRSLTLLLCILLMAGAAQADFSITNGDFEVGAGNGSVCDVNDWYDNNGGAFYADTWQSDASGLTPNGSQVVVFSGNDVAEEEGETLTGSYLYQSIGTSSGEASVCIAFDWGHPDDASEGRIDGLTVSVLANDGTFVADDANDVLDAAGVTLLDSASYEHTAEGTDGEVFSVVVTLDLSDANDGDEIFLRFNNYYVNSAQSWPILDNVKIAKPACLIVEDANGLMGFEPQMQDRLATLGYGVTIVEGDDVKSGDFTVEMAEAYDVIVVSEAISSSDVTSLAGADVPMMNGEGYGWHKMNYAENDGSASWQYACDANAAVDVFVVNDTHAIAVDANVALGSMEFLMDEDARATTSLVSSLAPGAECLVSMTVDGNDYALVFAIDEGAELAKDAGVAANRIVGFSLPGNDDVNNVLSDYGWELFDAAISWLDPAFAITNGDFEVGAGNGNVCDVNDWYDYNTDAFYADAWQTDASSVTPNGSQVVVFSGNDVAEEEGATLTGSYLYQSLGTSGGEATIAIAFDWGHPDDTDEGRIDGLTVSVLANDGTFVASDDVDVLEAEGVTLLDSASYEHTAEGTDGEIFSVVVELDLSAANAGDEIFVRFNNYYVNSSQSWPVLDNVSIAYILQD